MARVAITGATGLVGQALLGGLPDEGFAPFQVERAPPRGRTVTWDAATRMDPLGDVHGVIHLSGASIGAKRWSKRRRELLWESRLQSTRFLSEHLAAMEEPPQVLAVASGIGYYGNAPGSVDETGAQGQGFLADLCAAWEAAAAPARDAGVRVVHLRSAMVLAPGAAALRKMLLPFRLGLGGPIAGGAQRLPWVHVEDVVRAYAAALRDQRLEGPVNLVAGAPSQKAFARALGAVVHRPAVMPLPAFAVRLLFGQMGIEILTYGQKAKAKRLAEAGFHFKHTDLEAALDDVVHSDRPAKR